MMFLGYLYDLSERELATQIRVDRAFRWYLGMEAQRCGVSVAPAEIFAVDRKAATNAVRTSIGPPASQPILKAGLEILAGILGGCAVDDVATV